ncbi:MAG TPA: hypothetical protein VFI72_12625 [Candidatus Angelobacter sp.]|nr:hypothetical protein [Candidatus Angelobacter sp.]
MAETGNNKWNPGMGSDSEPQPKQDPDFGPGMEYEEGDRNRDDTTAEKIRERWQESRKSDPGKQREESGPGSDRAA